MATNAPIAFAASTSVCCGSSRGARPKARRKRQASRRRRRSRRRRGARSTPSRAHRAAAGWPATTGCRRRRPSRTSARARRSTTMAHCGRGARGRPSAASRRRRLATAHGSWRRRAPHPAPAAARGRGCGRARSPEDRRSVRCRDRAAGGGGQGPWLEDALSLGGVGSTRGVLRCARHRRGEAERDGDRGDRDTPASRPTLCAGRHSSSNSCVSRSVRPSGACRSNEKRQRPGMWNIRPSSRSGPSPSARSTGR